MKRTKDAIVAAAVVKAAEREVKKAFREIRKAESGHLICVERASLDRHKGLVHYETYRTVADEIFGAAGEKQKTWALVGAVEALLSVRDKEGFGDRVEASRMLALTLTLSGVGDGKPTGWLSAVNEALEWAILDTYDQVFASTRGATRTAKLNWEAVRYHMNRVQGVAGQMSFLASDSRRGTGKKRELLHLMADIVAEAEGLARVWHDGPFSAGQVFKDLLDAVIRYGKACMQGFGGCTAPDLSEATYGCIRVLRAVARARAALAASGHKAGLPDRYTFVCWFEGARATEAMHAEMGKLAAWLMRRRYEEALRAASR